MKQVLIAGLVLTSGYYHDYFNGYNRDYSDYKHNHHPVRQTWYDENGNTYTDTGSYIWGSDGSITQKGHGQLFRIVP